MEVVGDAMAKIYDVELRNTKIRQGVENWCIETDIYLQNTKVGFFLDDGYGGNSSLKYSCSKDIKNKFYYVAWRYFASYPDIDTLTLFTFTKEEFIELNTSLPKVSYRDWSDDKLALLFIEKLIYLYHLEQQFEFANMEGYSAILIVHYFTLKDIKAEQDKIYYFDNTIDQFNQIVDSITRRSRNFIVTKYESKKDFEIG